MSKPLDLYYWPTPNGWKITIFLEEAGLPYTIMPVNIGKGEQFKPEFLAISPNNRMPALVDHDGAAPVSVFESGAILKYLALKTGKFYPADYVAQAKVDEWLFWQVGGLGPMAGQAHHFRTYAQEKIAYAIDRYTNEVGRLYAVLNKQLQGKDYVCGDYSIADMAIWPWVVPWQMQGQNLDEMPNLKAWFERMMARPAVAKGFAVGKELRQPPPPPDSKEAEENRKILFGQSAKTVA